MKAEGGRVQEGVRGAHQLVGSLPQPAGQIESQMTLGLLQSATALPLRSCARLEHLVPPAAIVWQVTPTQPHTEVVEYVSLVLLCCSLPRLTAAAGVLPRLLACAAAVCLPLLALSADAALAAAASWQDGKSGTVEFKREIAMRWQQSDFGCHVRSHCLFA